jgi:hypothetical protein
MRKVLVFALVAAVVAVPAAFADKPASKPVASQKGWVKLGGGKNFGTSLAGLALAGVTVVPLKPAATVSSATRFPITQGKLILSKANNVVTGATGSVNHVGGLLLSSGDKSARVRNLVVVANLVAGSPDASKLTAQVNGKRLDLATITLGTVTVSGSTVTVPVATITLTADAATALNAALGTSLAGGAWLGSATLTARLVGHGRA